MAERLGNSASSAKKELSSFEDTMKTIRDYESMFEELKTMTGTTSLKEIISSYSSHEDEMFSLYRFPSLSCVFLYLPCHVISNYT